ncbi:MAG: transposase, partial [Pirellulaceae bacterium]|nr:transposase [Pirellulaceae bacterium]
LELLCSLPPRSLVVTDAAYHGYELAQEILAAGASFLVRVSSKVWLYTDTHQPLEEFQEGVVYYWPRERQQRREPPLRLRLIRVCSPRCKHDVWLLTDVLSSQRLSVAMAGQFYRWRWENEGLFRTFKRTLHKVKLVSRTVRLAHRELEGSLLAVQLMLAQAALKLHPCTSLWDEPVLASPRQVLLEIRREIREASPARRRPAFARRLTKAIRERRPRSSSKVARDGPVASPTSRLGNPDSTPLPQNKKPYAINYSMPPDQDKVLSALGGTGGLPTRV